MASKSLTAAITGHTAGIGKAIADKLSESGHQIQGYSRSNGFDLAEDISIQCIVDHAQQADVFVNNAYYEFAQCRLLELIYKHWKNSADKTIVNINSRAKYGTGSAKFYAQTKAELFAKAKHMMFSDKQCRIININPGYVDTQMVSHVQGKYQMLSPEQLADAVCWCINQPQGIEIGELSIWTTTLT